MAPAGGRIPETAKGPNPAPRKAEGTRKDSAVDIPADHCDYLMQQSQQYEVVSKRRCSTTRRNGAAANRLRDFVRGESSA